MADLRIRDRDAPRLERIGDSTYLASYLQHWAQVQPAAVAITYVDYDADRHGAPRSVTFGELDRWSRALAARINELTSPGDRVALLTPQGEAYAAAFCAAVSSQAIGVPLFAPDLLGQGDRLQTVVADCSPTVLLTTRDKLDLVTAFASEHALDADHIVVVDDYRDGHDDLVAAYAFPDGRQLDDIAYLQYTSGSTRAPVGVALTHRNLISNVKQLRDAFDIEFGNATTVSWLPLFHDMGLLLGVVSPIVAGLHSVMLDPVAFVLKPQRWLDAIDGRNNVMTAAPNFAFDYVVKRTRPEDRAKLDLSGVIGWINGAEPVLPATLERFAETFAVSGVTPACVKATYGLAEATVFVATSPLEEPSRIIEVDSEQFQQGIVTTEISAAMRPTSLVSCGRAVGQHLAIVDPATRQLLPDGTVGEIWIHGANVGAGYWQRPDDTDALFNAQLEGGQGAQLPSGGWLRTEDLGVVVDDHFYVTGRIKDLIIIDGRNIYPHDVEFTVEESHAAIAQRRLAAFSIPTESGEALVVVAERYRHAGDIADERDAIVAEARAAVSREHAIALHDLVLIEPDTIPRTSSGKIARKATAAAYRAGRLG